MRNRMELWKKPRFGTRETGKIVELVTESINKKGTGFIESKKEESKTFLSKLHLGCPFDTHMEM